MNFWLLCFPAPQSELLIMQVLMARLLDVGDFGSPAVLFHNPLGTENGIFVMVVPVDVVGIFDKVDISDDPPAVTVADTGNVPGGGVSSGYCLTQFNCLGHGPSFGRKRAICQNDRPPSIDERDTPSQWRDGYPGFHIIGLYKRLMLWMMRKWKWGGGGYK